MARLTVNLHVSEHDALLKLAKIELRDPRDQLRAILRAELERRGLLASAKKTLATDAARKVVSNEVAR
jgi:hypothetical protein